MSGEARPESGQEGFSWRLQLGRILAEEHLAIWGEHPPPTNPADQRKAEEDLAAAKNALRAAAKAASAEQSAAFEQADGRLSRLREDDYYASVHGREQEALCLSGGGIRSAAFALGILQGLARRGRLSRFHYLSTVSGGGYIGGWLTRWIKEAGSAAAVETALARSVPPAGADTAANTTGFCEPEEITRLRERSNFLTPRIGLASADTWTAATIVIRNLLLNWLVFGPALLLLAFVFNVYRDLFRFLAVAGGPWWSWCATILLALPLGVAVTYACRDLPTHARAAKRSPSPPAIRRRIVVPALVWSGGLPLALAPLLLNKGATGISPALLAAGCSFVAALVGYGVAWAQVEKDDRRQFWINVPVWLVAAGVASATLALGVHLAAPLADPSWGLGILIALGPLWITIAQLMLSVVYAGFRRTPGPREAATASIHIPTPDLDREWLARLSAAKLQPPFAWVLGGFGCLVLPALILDEKASMSISGWIVSAVATTSGALAVFGGWSSLSKFVPGMPTDASGAAPSWRPSFGSIVTVATAVFIAVLLMLFAWAEDALVALVKTRPTAGAQVLAQLFVAGVLALLLALTSSQLKVNRFSLHGLYRNRLVRAFLGAARPSQGTQPSQRDQFTDFDASDNIRAAAALPQGIGQRRLFPVLNLALNVTGGDRLAWQERKAISFTVTPQACGWTDPLARASGQPAGAYVATDHYAGMEPDSGMPGLGISLGTAMTISGAAASPNMGYHSSPATAFVMTLFNVRLGAWLPNPAARNGTAKLMERSSPRNALGPLMRELSGNADATKPFAYLSDGGHFDNLGLYEMVRRRCRRILVSDAGCDPDCHFADLGMAVRKIWIDLGIRIAINTTGIVPRVKADGQSVAWAVGSIHYPEAGSPTGTLVYVKPSYDAGNAPIDVRAYAEVERTFPHQSTGDQWFSESQFESYRHLGEATLARLGQAADDGHAQLGKFF